MIDADDQLIEGPVEGVGPAGAHGVGDGPMQTSAVGGQFFVGVIADRDDHVGRLDNVIEMARGVGPHRQFAARRRGHRLRVYLGGGMSPGRGCRQRAAAIPHRHGQLAARRILGADKHHPLGTPCCRRHQQIQRLGDQLQIATTTISFRTDSAHDSRALKHPQMVGDQAR